MKCFSFVLIFAAAMALGCKKQAQTAGSGVSPEGGVAIYSVFSDPMVIWDPSDTLSDEVIVFQNVYETLLRYNFSEKQYDRVLAESYFRSEDGLLWTFKLRNGVKFHSGGELNAGMVKRSIERLLERGYGAIELWDCLSEINIIDDFTVEFKLNFADNFEQIVSSAYGAYIFDVDAAEANGEAWFEEGNDAGSGPYKILRWTGGVETALVWFPEYWGGWHEKNFSTIVFKVTPEATVRQLQLETGEVDISMGLLSEQLEALRKDPDIFIEDADKFENLTLLFNTEKPPLSDPMVRRAIAYAIPYEDIVDKVMLGNARKARGYVPRGLWGHDENLFSYAQDKAMARRLLTSSGAAGSQLTITYVAEDETERQVAEILRTSLAEIGLNLRLQGMPWDAQWDRAKAPNPSDRQDLLLILFWPTYADPYNLLSMAYKSEDSINLNLAYYKNEKFDSIIEDARHIAGTDNAGAAALYKKAQEMLIRDVPGIAVFDTKGSLGFRKDFEGHKSNPYYTGVVYFYKTWRKQAVQ
ncbi:MAG: ABC transporter substrate-binding protein [Spirochaetaceae bacterium]|jgi:peptide/nickel transport system substrate-binding protein|nr:ABC transporter substrate-binding protein [Spirochaetaceae bacterium]